MFVAGTGHRYTATRTAREHPPQAKKYLASRGTPLQRSKYCHVFYNAASSRAVIAAGGASEATATEFVRGNEKSGVCEVDDDGRHVILLFSRPEARKGGVLLLLCLLGVLH